jgi:hypothetical protein
MKSSKIITGLLIITSLVSCKEEKEKSESKFFTVTLNVTAKNDDGFQVFYKEVNDDTKPFDEANAINVVFKGSDKPQDLVFNLPVDVFPTNFRIDVGNNKETKEIVVNNFKMSYNNKNFEAKGAAFFNYFAPDAGLAKYDVAGSKILPITTESGYYDPMVFSNDLLESEIVKLSN